jgi:flagellar capping protein FliD
MSMSVDGLVSGMDTTSIISQLLSVEAGPQNALKTKLSTTQTNASAYRTVNTTFLAVTAAADAVLKPDLWTTTKATSSASAYATASASPGALTGSLTFSVTQLATSHAVVNRNTGTWTASTAAYGASSIQVFDKSGTSKGTIAIGGTQTVADAAKAINASTLGLTAAVVQISPTEVALQVTATATGAASEFSFTGAGTFTKNSQAQDAQLSIGTINPYTVSSPTNTFSSVLPGTTITAVKADPGTPGPPAIPPTPVTVSVVSDPDAIATKVSALVDAVNASNKTVKDYTSNATGSTAALKGDYSVSSLGGALLDAVSFAVGKDGSPAKVGFTLQKDGTVVFDKTKFLAALKDTPALAQRMLVGAPAQDLDGNTANGNEVPAVTGIAARLRAVAVSASDATTGTLVALANGQDSMIKDIKDRIADWDLRLAKRKETLTRQFTAMETALSSLKNQSNWLAGQLSSLPGPAS